MKTILGLVLRHKEVEKYNLIASIEDVKRMLQNLHFMVDGIDACLRHAESHIPCESKGGSLGDLLGSSVHAPVIISSSDED